MKELIQQKLQEIVKNLTNKEVEISVSMPKDISNGDYTTNVAFQVGKLSGKNPFDIAQDIAKELEAEIGRRFGEASPLGGKLTGIERIEAVAPGYINFHLSTASLSKNVEELLSVSEKVALTTKMENQRMIVEFAHPNTHKELHIGHMRTLTTGESVARLLEANGVKVFRANYQGDIGPHVAKAMYGVEKMLQEQSLTLEEVEKWPFAKKAHFLGLGYARGSKDYGNDAKEEIDALNVALYKRDATYQELYNLTRKWSLDYYDEFYNRFYTKFDKLFFEGDLDKEAVALVNTYVGKVFTQDTDGSIIFKGEQYGLHTRVFITQKGTPTYEGKEIALGFAEYKAFPFDMKIHVVASEQAGYFQVVFKALELIDPEKFKGHQYHLSMGMVQLVGRKMSSRTGDVLTVDELLEKVKEAANGQFKEDKVEEKEKEDTLEKIVIGAVKYAILKGAVKQNAVFDIEKSVSLDGNSGPYMQYAYTRTQSILRKAESMGIKARLSPDYTILEDEKKLMQKLVQFVGIVEIAGENLAPSTLCEYLFETAQQFNNFYQKYKIVTAVKNEEKEFRLFLTAAVGSVLKKGLYLLGIKAPERM